MKTFPLTVLATTAALIACSAAMAADNTTPHASARVAYSEPEKFTDFRKSMYFRETDAEELQNELTRAVERSASSALPPGYTLEIRFTDIDLAGDINPNQRTNFNDVRVYRGIYAPRLSFDYAVRDPQGGTVLAGSEKLTDMAYDMKTRPPQIDYTHFEAELMQDFISGLSRKIAKGTS